VLDALAAMPRLFIVGKLVSGAPDRMEDRLRATTFLPARRPSEAR